MKNHYMKKVLVILLATVLVCSLVPGSIMAKPVISKAPIQDAVTSTPIPAEDLDSTPIPLQDSTDEDLTPVETADILTMAQPTATPASQAIATPLPTPQVTLAPNATATPTPMPTLAPLEWPAPVDLSKFTKVTENDSLEMWVRNTDHNVAIKQKWDGYIWTSFPVREDPDPTAKVLRKSLMGCHIIVKVLDKNSSGNDFNSLYHSLRAMPPEDVYDDKTGDLIEKVPRSGLPNAEMKTITKNGETYLRFEYYFLQKRFFIPVEFHLLKDSVQASVVVKDIQEASKDEKITEIRLEPYFGTSNNQEKGYMLVPDGSGALIHFGNGMSSFKEYSINTFGSELITEVKRYSFGIETNRLPVFGMSRQEGTSGHGLLGVIDNGEAVSRVEAFVGGGDQSYNNVYARFSARLYDTFILTRFSGDPLSFLNFKEKYLSAGIVSVRYYPLKGKGDYVNMAEGYRQYLVDEKGLKKPQKFEANQPFYVELYGAVSKKVSVLGFPTIRNIPLTTYDEAIGILQEAKRKGIGSPVLQYRAWTVNAQLGKIMNKVEPDGGLGGKAGFQRLMQYTKDNHIPFYPDFDLLNASKDGNGYSQSSQGTSRISGYTAINTVYDYSTLVKNTNVSTAYWSMLSPRFVFEHASTLANNVSRENLSAISLASLTNEIYSDGEVRKYMDRDAAQRQVVKALDIMRNKNISLMGTAGNGYAIPFVSHMVDVPQRTSDFMILDEEVPFYQIVLRGYVQYSTVSLNMQSSPRLYFLKAIESGSALKFTWIKRSGDAVKDTPLNSLFAVELYNWMDEASAMYKEWAKVYSEIGESSIVGHEKFAGDYTCTTFANGHKIYVNYSQQPVKPEGTNITVASMGYAVVK